MFAAFEVGYLATVSGGLPGLAAHVGKQSQQFAAGLGVAGHQLQMVALAGLCYTPPRQKGAPKESRPAALFFQQAEIDVQHRTLPGIKAESVDHLMDLFRVGELENVFPIPLSRQPVKPQAEGPVQQDRKPVGEAPALCNDTYLPGGEGVAIEQHAVGFRPGTAEPVHP